MPPADRHILHIAGLQRLAQVPEVQRQRGRGGRPGQARQPAARFRTRTEAGAPRIQVVADVAGQMEPGGGYRKAVAPVQRRPEVQGRTQGGQRDPAAFTQKTAPTIGLHKTVDIPHQGRCARYRVPALAMVQGLRQIERIARRGEPRMHGIRLPAEEAPPVPLHGRDVHRVDAVHQFPGNRNPVSALYRRGQPQQPFGRSQTALPLLPRLPGRRPGRIGRSQIPLTARLRAGMTAGFGAFLILRPGLGHNPGQPLCPCLGICPVLIQQPALPELLQIRQVVPGIEPLRPGSLSPCREL